MKEGFEQYRLSVSSMAVMTYLWHARKLVSRA